jgi:hypothetical protein
MLNKFLGSLKILGADNTFQGYLNGLHRRGNVGIPTVDEAKKDYRAYLSITLYK